MTFGSRATSSGAASRCTSRCRPKSLRDRSRSSGFLGNVRALLGNGDGTFAESTSRYARNVARAVSVALGDLTGDGRLDLVVASSGHVGPVLNYGGLRVLPNDGNGALAASVPYDASTSANFVALGDLNGDAKTDVAVIPCPRSVPADGAASTSACLAAPTRSARDPRLSALGRTDGVPSPPFDAQMFARTYPGPA